MKKYFIEFWLKNQPEVYSRVKRASKSGIGSVEKHLHATILPPFTCEDPAHIENSLVEHTKDNDHYTMTLEKSRVFSNYLLIDIKETKSLRELKIHLIDDLIKDPKEKTELQRIPYHITIAKIYRGNIEKLLKQQRQFEEYVATSKLLPITRNFERLAILEKDMDKQNAKWKIYKTYNIATKEFRDRESSLERITNLYKPKSN